MWPSVSRRRKVAVSPPLVCTTNVAMSEGLAAPSTRWASNDITRNSAGVVLCSAQTSVTADSLSRDSRPSKSVIVVRSTIG